MNYLEKFPSLAPLPIRIIVGITFIIHGLPKFENIKGTNRTQSRLRNYIDDIFSNSFNADYLLTENYDHSVLLYYSHSKKLDDYSREGEIYSVRYNELANSQRRINEIKNTITSIIQELQNKHDSDLREFRSSKSLKENRIQSFKYMLIEVNNKTNLDNKKNRFLKKNVPISAQNSKALVMILYG